PAASTGTGQGLCKLLMVRPISPAACFNSGSCAGRQWQYSSTASKPNERTSRSASAARSWRVPFQEVDRDSVIFVKQIGEQKSECSRDRGLVGRASTMILPPTP